MPNRAADAGSSIYRYRFGQVEFDEARFELTVGGLIVEIERKPLLVLLELMRNADEVVSRDWLLDTVWGGRPTVQNALSNCVLKLRRALGDADGSRLKTVSKGGYRLVGDIRRESVGRRMVSQLRLVKGDSVPGREDVRLETQLGASPGNEVWLARHSDGKTTVFKFGLHGESETVLKRETTSHRYLLESLGERADFVSLITWNFRSPPCYIETAYSGHNLVDWSAQDNRLKNLSPSDRLEMFLQAADAIAAAHSVGLLHKDLKPTNIFVLPLKSGYQVKVGDLGNARMLNPDRLEEFGITRLGMTLTAEETGVLGTPLYLAPELLAGGVATVQSDVYALGLLLWQLVGVGDFRRPLASGWQHEIDDPLLEDDILQATTGDPRRRLTSVAELTNRLRSWDERRHLRDAALLSEQRAIATANALERAKVRRPWVIASLAILAIGLATSLWSYRDERRARVQSQMEKRRAEAINAFLADMLQSADPATPGGAAQTTIVSVLDRAEGSLLQKFGDDPTIKGSIELTIGNTFSGLGAYRKALKHHQEAFELLNKASGSGDPMALNAAYHLAGTLDMLSSHQEAQTILDNADAAAGSRLFAPSPLSFLARSSRGGHYLLQMHAVPALEQFQIMEQIRQSVDPTNEMWLVHTRSGLAWCDVRLDRNAEALQMLTGLISKQYSPQYIGILEWEKIHLQYGIALSNLGRFTEAETIIKEIKDEAERELGGSAYHVGLAYNYLAAIYKLAGDWGAASEAANRELTIWNKSVGPTHQSSLAALADTAIIDYLKAPNAHSLSGLKTADETISHVLGAQSPFSQYVSFYLANALLDEGDSKGAAAPANDLNPLDLASADPSPDWRARVEALKGRLLLSGSRQEEGIQHLESSMATLDAHGARPWILLPIQLELQKYKRVVHRAEIKGGGLKAPPQ